MNDIAATGRSIGRLTLRSRLASLEEIVRDFLGLDDWSDELIAPRSLIERAQSLVCTSSIGTPFAPSAPLAASLTWSPTLDCGRVDHAGALKAVATLNEQAFQGHTDWRLPEIRELLSLVDYTRADPAIDTGRFPDTKSASYWTATPYAGVSGAAWVVGFDGGYASWYGHYDDAFVRAVRGPVARARQ